MGVDIFGIHAGDAGAEIGVRALGADGDLLPHARFFEPFADDLFAIAVAAIITGGVPRAIDVGSVDKGAAQFGEAVEQFECIAC